MFPQLLAVAASVVVPPVHLALAFAPVGTVPPAVQRIAVGEAAAIWSPAGVAIDAADASGHAPADAVVLTVVMTASTPAARANEALGAIEFAFDGTPNRVICIFLDRLLLMLGDASIGDVPLWRRPRGFSEQALGRALGRIIAHEIGHFVLQSTEHARQGLMGPVYRTDDLIAPGRNRYHLRP